MSLLMFDGMATSGSAPTDSQWVVEGTNVVVGGGTARACPYGGTVHAMTLITNTSQATAGMYRDFTPSAAIVAGFAVQAQVDTNGQGSTSYIVRLQSGATEVVTLKYETNGGDVGIRLGGQAGTLLTTIPKLADVNLYTYVEIEADVTAGTLKVWVGSVLQANLTGVAFGVSTLSRIKFGSSSNSQNLRSQYIDDVYVVSKDATAPNARLGMPYVVHLVPTATSGALGTAVASIDAPTDAGLPSSVNGDTQTMTLQDLTNTTGASIYAVEAHLWARLDSGLGGSFQYGLSLSGTDDLGVTTELDTTRRTYRRPVARPGGGAWTAADLNAAIGKVVSNVTT